MVRGNLKPLVQFLAALAIAAGCTPYLMGPSDQNSSLIIGRVILDNKFVGHFYGLLPVGTVEKGLEIEVLSRDGKQTFKATTEEQGYFFVPNLPPNTYLISRITIEGGSSRGEKERYTLPVRRPVFTPVTGKVTNIGTLLVEVSEKQEHKIREARDEEKTKSYFLQRYSQSPWSSREFVSVGIGVASASQLAQTKKLAANTTTAVPSETKADKPEWKAGNQWRYSWKTPAGSGTLTREVVREDVFDGIPVYVMRVGKNEYSYTKDALTFLADVLNGKLTIKRTPGYQMFSWPMYVGKEWRSTYVSENLVEKSSQNIDVRVVVSSRERVQVTAGVFDAHKIDIYNAYTGNFLEEHWYSSETKWLIKSRRYLQAGLREEELISFKAD
jgi:hypothetical protein